MNEDGRKHLEFIQNIISRMSANSFLIKGWMVGLVSALFALAAKDADRSYVLVTYFAIPMFWLLDGYYLSLERQYRALYDAVRQSEGTNFSLDVAAHRTGKNTWLAAVFSPVLSSVYVLAIGVAIFVMFALSAKK